MAERRSKPRDRKTVDTHRRGGVTWKGSRGEDILMLCFITFVMLFGYYGFYISGMKHPICAVPFIILTILFAYIMIKRIRAY